MKNFFNISLLLMILTLGTTFELHAQDQKFGYLNSNEILLMLPEAKDADTQLETYQKKLSEGFQKKVENFQSDAAAFQKKMKDGLLNQKEQQEIGASLQKRQEALGKEEYDLSLKLEEKREELLEPILEKIDQAIKAVGKEGKFTMIFNSSGMNVMLYANETVNVMPKVKAKLNLK